MFELSPSSWPVAVDATDPRNQFHERALFEARVATDHREQTAAVEVASMGRKNAGPTGERGCVTPAAAGAPPAGGAPRPCGAEIVTGVLTFTSLTVRSKIG